MKAYVNAHELLAATKFVDAKSVKNRPVLNAVHVVVRKDDYTIESTDSFKVIRFFNDKNRKMVFAENEDKDEFACLIGIDVIKNAVKASDDIVCLEYNDETQDINLDVYKRVWNKTLSVSTKNVEGTYPSVERVFVGNRNTTDRTSAVALGSTYLMDICKAVECAYGKKTPIVFNLGKANEPVGFSCEHEQKKDESGNYRVISRCDGVIMPVRM